MNKELLQRGWANLVYFPWLLRKAFPKPVQEELVRKLSESQLRQRGEIRLIIEGSLTTQQLLHRLTPRERALDLFGLLRLWDTEENNGVLIYLLLAERKLEIIADRGINRHVPQEYWERLARHLAAGMAKEDYQAAAARAVSELSLVLEKLYPMKEGETPSELPEDPLLLL